MTTRVLVAEDSLTQRETLTTVLSAAGFEVVGAAEDGAQAVMMAAKLKPDVVLMDVVMPNLDGIAATRTIMCESPTPIVVLTALHNDSELFDAYDALSAGALEVCAKPTAQGSDEGWSTLIKTVSAAARVRVSKPVVSRIDPVPPPGLAENRARSPASVVVIGASTGGPAALRQILRALPADYAMPTIVALHCNPSSGNPPADWFSQQCRVPVRTAESGRPLADCLGQVLFAPAGHHVTVRGDRLHVAPADASDLISPSVDRLFFSAAHAAGDAAAGVLLSGMGEDGASGLKAIRDHGGRTFVQDEASSVVFGMPGTALTIGAARYPTNLDQIAPALTRLSRAARGHNPPGERSPWI